MMHIFPTDRIRGMLFLFTLVFTGLQAHAGAPEEFRAVYRVEKFNSDLGLATYQLKRDGDKLHFFMRTELTGFIALFRDDRVEEDSWLREKNGALELQRYRYKQAGSKRNRNTQLNIHWSESSDRGTASGTHAGKPVSIEVAHGVSDALSFQLQLMRDAADDSRALDYAVLSKDELKQYNFSRIGDETLVIRNREINTLVVERQHGNRQTRLWLAKEFQYTPVRIELIEDDEIDTSMRIDTLTQAGKQVL